MGESHTSATAEPHSTAVRQLDIECGTVPGRRYPGHTTKGRRATNTGFLRGLDYPASSATAEVKALMVWSTSSWVWAVDK